MRSVGYRAADKRSDERLKHRVNLRQEDRGWMPPKGPPMMTRWVVSIPVWGDEYFRIFEKVTMPALSAALGLTNPALEKLLIIHTDDRERALKAVGDAWSTQILPVPAGDGKFGSMSDAHREAVKLSREWDYLVFLTADLVMSPSTLASAEARFSNGKFCFTLMGMRVCYKGERPPWRKGGAELLRWGWQRRHPMTKECTWPDGRSADLWRMYFTNGSSVVCRLCLPHPLVIIVGSNPVQFKPTVDVSVVNNFTPDQIHLVTDPNEAALIELSPPDKEFIMAETMEDRLHGRSTISVPSVEPLIHSMHKYMLTHRIVVVGPPDDCGEDPLINRLLGGPAPVYS